MKKNSPDKIRLLMRLRNAGITDTRVLSAMENVPRELFVPDTFRDRAYEDTPLPITFGQTISQPSIVAWMTVALEVGERMCVLEIGTGSGYQAAILSKLARRVYTIERHKELLREAEGRFEVLGLRNITTQHGDGAKGWKVAAPFDRIIVTAAAPDIPPALLDQLAVGGVMVIPVGEDPVEQQLLRIVRTEEGYESEPMMDVRFVPLVSE